MNELRDNYRKIYYKPIKQVLGAKLNEGNIIIVTQPGWTVDSKQ